jgi:hypothetical protein
MTRVIGMRDWTFMATIFLASSFVRPFNVCVRRKVCEFASPAAGRRYTKF